MDSPNIVKSFREISLIASDIKTLHSDCGHSQPLLHDLPLAGAPVLLHVGPLHHVEVGQRVSDHALLRLQDPVCKYEELYTRVDDSMKIESVVGV